MHTIHIPRRFVRHSWGGTETVVLETCKRLQAAGDTARIFCPEALATSRHETMDGVEVTRFPYFYPYLGLRPAARELLDQKGGNLFSFELLRALQKEPKLDLIHLHTMKRLGGIARTVAQKRKIPYVVSLHGGAFDVPTTEAASLTAPTAGTLEWGKLLGMWVGSNRVLDDAAAILCVGENERRAVQKRYPNQRVEYFPNGVDVARLKSGIGAAFRQKRGIPEDAFLLLTVARIDLQKNQLLLIQALPEILKHVPNAHVALIGAVTNADYHAALEREIQKLGLSGHVTLIPGLPHDSAELRDAYRAADGFVLPSLHEPFGIVILEAWAAGLPVAASKVGGIPFLVEDGKDGHLFDASTPASLAAALIPFCQLSAEKRQELGQRGYCKASTQYDWAVLTERLQALYAEVTRK